MENHVDAFSLLKSIYDSTFDYGIFTFDLHDRITTWNAGAERIIGFSPVEIIGQNNAIIFTPEDRIRDEPRQETKIAVSKGRAEDYRWHLRKDGSRFWADGVLTPIHDASGQHIGFLKILRDITDRKIAEVEIQRIAHSDLLTGLANRYSFEIHATEMIAMALRSGQQMALQLIDLDRFKQVNDSLGHHAGDLLLQQAARRMREALRESDFVARLGGDEFVVLQPNLPSTQAGADLAAKLIKTLSIPFDLNGTSVQIGSSIGIAICPGDAHDLDQLMKKADLALYRAKEDGKGKFHYFTEKLDAIAHKKGSELAHVRHAVASKSFRVEYQPKISFATGKTVGMEALVRCSHPALAEYTVEEIIALTIEAGLMKELSYWVMHQACAQLREWKDSGLQNLKMSINLCSRDMTDEETPIYLDTLLSEMKLEPGDLEIEITERQALDIERYGMNILNDIRERGINVALDDFGTGYSALSYLRDLPVTAVKLDKSFLVNIPDNVQGCEVIKAVMNLSHALGLETIAEGVETDEQADFLKTNNCAAGISGFTILACR